MTHKFAQVRVKIDASTIATAITDIGTVTVLGGKTVNLTERTGSVSIPGTNADAAQEVEFPPSTSNVRTSNYYTYWQAITGVSISSITLTISSVAKTFTGLAVDFAKTLAAGKSYTLEVDLKKLIFAGSNIYWDAGNSWLTFDEVGNSDYQGVFFKWGSLVGISPIGSSPNIPSVALYIPDVGAGTWDGTKTVSTSDWGSCESIPFFDLTGSISGNMYGNYLYDHPDFGNYIGDICAYLTGKTGVPAGSWRIPNMVEFGDATNYSGWIEGSTSVLNAEGTGIMGRGKNYFSLFFPASGQRFPSGSLQQVGNYAYYRTGSISEPNKLFPYMMWFDSPNGSIRGTGTDNDFTSVRCVKI
jgi:hypothetical protein